jgi:hypothetical protein
MCLPSESAVTRGRRGGPRWMLLYGATMPQLAVLAVVEASAPAAPLRIVLRWVLALATFAGMGLWVRANRAAFDLQNWCDCAPQKMTIRVIESHRPLPIPAPAPFEPRPAWAEEPAEPVLR